MINAIRVLMAVLATALTFAAPAAADQDSYLLRLQPQFVYLSAQQLLDEGARICGVLSSGQSSPNAVVMVTKDLGISISAALEIVSAAEGELDC